MPEINQAKNMTKDNIRDKAHLIHELELNLWEMWSHFGRAQGCALHDEGDVMWFETPIPILPYHVVMKFQATEHIDQKIDKLVKQFNDRQVPFMWIVHPSASPQDLPNRLEARGLREVEIVTGMTRELTDLPELPPLPENIEIREVIQPDDANQPDDASQLFEFAAWRWDVPEAYREQLEIILEDFRFGQSGSKMHAWQAWRDGKPVAKTGMCVADKSAGIYAVVTRPEARRLGLARNLTFTALEKAQKLGKHLAVLHSTPMAESLYQSLGFEPVVKFRLFASGEMHI